MLELRNISAGYGTFQALFDVSLKVDAGEAVAVIGPNGAGKTTLLRVISKLIEPTSGESLMEGRRLNDVEPHRVIELGIAHVPENRRLFPRLTVEENLRMGALPARRRGHASRSGSSAGLRPFPAAGGAAQPARGHDVRRRAADVRDRPRAHVGPKLLLLDEPSAGLAPVIVQSIFAVVRQIRDEGYTVLIVEQNVQQVLKVVDRAYLLEVGRIKTSGRSAELAASDEIRRAYVGL